MISMAATTAAINIDDGLDARHINCISIMLVDIGRQSHFHRHFPSPENVFITHRQFLFTDKTIKNEQRSDLTTLCDK